MTSHPRVVASSNTARAGIGSLLCALPIAILASCSPSLPDGRVDSAPSNPGLDAGTGGTGGSTAGIDSAVAGDSGLVGTGGSAGSTSDASTTGHGGTGGIGTGGAGGTQYGDARATDGNTLGDGGRGVGGATVGTGGIGGRGAGGTGTGGTGTGGAGGLGMTGGSGGGGIVGTGGTGAGGTGGTGGTGGQPDASVIPPDAEMDVPPDVPSDVTGPVDDVPTPDAPPACTQEGAIQCSTAGIETCAGGQWALTQSCPQGCTANQCNTGAVTCRAGEVACFESSVKVCNPTGTAWLASMVCPDRCQAGLCVGTCTPNIARCSGSTRQVCNAAGSAWVDDPACTLGCDQTVCKEGAHANQGNVETLQGPHSYQGCFTMELGGSVSVPADKTLEIWATCFTMAAGTTVSLGTGASFIVHASETVDVAGTIKGGSLVKLMAWNTLKDSGTINSGTVTLRADNLEYKTGATVTGVSAALYGASFVNDAAFPGTVSVMPPETLSSVNAPDSGWWNWPAAGLDVSWPRPFPGAVGYYVSVGDAVPGPGSGTLTVPEHITLDASAFSAGANRIRVVSVNPTSVVGTYPVDLNLYLNIKPPLVSSTSHPVEGQWYATSDLFMSWTDPAGAPAGSFTGYRFILDHAADTVPTATTGTFTTQKQVLLPGQSGGIWFFHIVSVDRAGRTTPVAAHYQVRIGDAAATGNIAGHIQAEDGTALAGVHVSIAGGLLHTYSSATGDYSFQDQVPASTLAYMVTAALPGYATASSAALVSAGATTVKSFTLPAGTTSYRLGLETPLYTGSVGMPAFAMGPRDKIIWSSAAAQVSSGTLEAVTIARTTGDALLTDSTLYGPASFPAGPTDVGWDGTRFFAQDNFGCDAFGGSITNNERSYGCSQMRTYDSKGQVAGGWTGFGLYTIGGFTSLTSGAAVWNGSGYKAFFMLATRGEYDTYFWWSIGLRELDSSLHFTDTNTCSAVTKLDGASPSYETGESSTLRLRALWDGTNHGVAFATSKCGFVRYDVNHVRVGDVTTVESSCVPGAAIGLVFDGSGYHSAYVARGTTSNTLVLRGLGADGSVGAATTVADLGAGGTADPVLAYDHRNVLLAYQKAGTSVLEIRSLADHALVTSMNLGTVTSPLVAFNPQTAQGGVVYLRNGTLYFRGLFAD